MKKIILCVLFCCFSFYASNSFAKTEVVRPCEIKINGKPLKCDYYFPNPKKLPSDVLVLVPGWHDEHLTLYERIGNQWKELARKKNWAIVSLHNIINWRYIFSDSKSDEYSEYWSGKVLNTMLESFGSVGVHFKSVYLVGDNEGARFALTYSLLYPKKVIKTAIIAIDSIVPIKKHVPVKFFYAADKSYPYGKKVVAKNLNTFAKQAKVHNINVSYKIYEYTPQFLLEWRQDVIDFLNE